MQSIPCREGCGHARFKSKLAETTHYHRVHTGRIPNRPCAQLKINGNGNGDGHTTEVELEKPDKVDRRSRAWRLAHPDLAKPIGERSHRSRNRRRYERPPAAEVQVNYCPQCGFHIHAVALGMAVAEKMKGKL